MHPAQGVFTQNNSLALFVIIRRVRCTASLHRRYN